MKKFRFVLLSRNYRWRAKITNREFINATYHPNLFPKLLWFFVQVWRRAWLPLQQPTNYRSRVLCHPAVWSLHTGLRFFFINCSCCKSSLFWNTLKIGSYDNYWLSKSVSLLGRSDISCCISADWCRMHLPGLTAILDALITSIPPNLASTGC